MIGERVISRSCNWRWCCRGSDGVVARKYNLSRRSMVSTDNGWHLLNEREVGAKGRKVDSKESVGLFITMRPCAEYVVNTLLLR